MPRSLAALLALLPLVGLTATAHAAPFDVATGTVLLDGEGISWGLDDLASKPSELQMWFNGPRYEEISESTLSARFEAADQGLEGTGALLFGGDVSSAMVSLHPLSRFRDRRVEISLWQRAEGTRLDGTVYWFSGDVAGAIASGDMRGLHTLAMLPMIPTGRATGDGWVELSSGPFDFYLGGAVPPAFLNLSDPHADGSYWDPSITYDPSLRVRLDAFELRDLGPAAVATAACRLPTEDETCGELGLCLMGRCTEAAPIVGPAFASASMREDYVTRRTAEFELFDGSRMAQSRMQALRDARTRLAAEALPKRFWTGLGAAVEQLYDGHASAPMAAYTEGASGGACVALGEADLLEGGGLLPMVFQASTVHPAGKLLRPGDVITAIDGEAPSAWRALAGRWISYPGDPRADEVISTGQLLGAAVLAGAKVTFSRCEAADAAGACAAAPVTVEIDYATVVGEALWSMTPPSWAAEGLGCDFRFKRVPEVADSDSYALASSTVQDGVTYVIFNGFPSPDYREGVAWTAAHHGALSPGPERLVIDERQGYGGTVTGLNYLSSFLVGTGDFYRMELFPNMEWPLDDDLLSALRSCGTTSTAYFPCGMSEGWSLSDYPNDAAGAAVASRTALLISSDVSGNDFFTKLMTYRAAETRIFGPTVTWGAFGPIISLPIHLGELAGGSFQIQDTRFLQTGFEPTPEFTTGTGVAPHEVVHQKQSDALAGVDTILETAKAWVLQ